MSPSDFLAEMFAAHELDLDGESVGAQLAPGKLWHELAADLFVSNLAFPAWGWADARNLWTMDFWAAFDSQVRFVLTFASPEHALGIAMADGEMSASQCESFLKKWSRENDELLRFYHRHSDRCVLINSDAARCSPAKFLEAINPKLGLDLQLPAGFAADAGIEAGAVRATLARPLVGESSAAAELFRELDSAADLDGALLTAESTEALAAWREFRNLGRRIAEADSALGESRQLCALKETDLGVLREQVAAMHASAQIRDAEWLARESGLLAKVGELETVVLQTRGELADANGELAPLKAEMGRLTEENELLLLQLHQMQDELMHYTTENQQLLDRLEQPLTRSSEAYTPLYQKTEAFIDLTGEIDGENWYYAEHDGRWAGPDRLSTLRVAALKAGEYGVTIDIVDAKAVDILNGMQLSINGMPLVVTFDGEGVVAIVRSRFSSEQVPPGSEWEFQFRFPRLISPVEHGSDDSRVLAVRVRSIELHQIV
ncbi:MAG: hypothetical protein JNN20_18420 [Betaproteobacteria bacterium]|nr:hypothetical protein [Betaproteobacteria bacterium]